MLRAVLHYRDLPHPMERAETGSTVGFRVRRRTHEILMMALGAFLDENEVPPFPSSSEYTLRVPVTSELFSVFETSPSDDELLSTYTEGRVYWSWKYKLRQASFYRWEAQRLGVRVDDLHHASHPKVNSLLELAEGNSYRPLPKLLRYYEDKIKDLPEGDPSTDHYDVAISFAGEQRQFVKEFATSLKEQGATVFYDDFVDLWAKISRWSLRKSTGAAHGTS